MNNSNEGNPIGIIQKLKKGITKPSKIPSYIYRVLRNRKLRKSGNFLDFYAGVVDDNADRLGTSVAVGSLDDSHWEEVGQLQIDYLLQHGLTRQSRLLDIGCGNLRFGWLAIDFLEEGNYTGVDISRTMIDASLKYIGDKNLSRKRPYIYLDNGYGYPYLNEQSFDVVVAHSVFSHLPKDVIEDVIKSAHKVLKPGAFFDFTFKRAKGKDEYNYLEEDFYYSDQLLLDICKRNGFEATVMTDWEYSQEKIRATKIL